MTAIPCVPPRCEHGRTSTCLACVVFDAWLYERLPSEYQLAMRRRPVAVTFTAPILTDRRVVGCDRADAAPDACRGAA